jgi:hypothetical protein
MGVSYERALGGTGSNPPLPKGLQRNIRLTARAVPRSAPWVLIASSAYREQVGENRHCPPSHPESVIRYSLIAPRRATRAGAPRVHRCRLTDVIDDSALDARGARSSRRSDLGCGHPAWPREPRRRRRAPPPQSARPCGAPLARRAGLGSSAPRRRPSCRRRARSPPNLARRTRRSVSRERADPHGRLAGSPRCAPSRSARNAEAAAALAPPRGEDRPAGPRPHPKTEAVGLRPAAGVRLIRALSLGHRQIPCERKAGYPPAEGGSIRKHPRMEGLTTERASRGQRHLALWKNPVL